MIDREQFIGNLVKLQRHLCGYRLGKESEGETGFCDCKFGCDDFVGESCGCPEVRLVIALLQVMADVEYAGLLRRAYERLPSVRGDAAWPAGQGLRSG